MSLPTHAARQAALAEALAQIEGKRAALVSALELEIRATDKTAASESEALEAEAKAVTDAIDAKISAALAEKLVVLFRLWQREPSRAASEKLFALIREADAAAVEQLGVEQLDAWPVVTAFVAAHAEINPSTLSKFSDVDGYSHGILDAAGVVRRAAMAGSVPETDAALRDLELKIATKLRNVDSKPSAEQLERFAVLASGIRHGARQARLAAVHAKQANAARERFEREYAAAQAESA